MGDETRRLDRGDNTTDLSGKDAETRRLGSPDVAPQVRCLRCGGAMIETRAGYRAAGELFMNVTPTSLRPSIWGNIRTVSMKAMTCMACGYTEFYADDLVALQELIDQAEREELKRKAEDAKPNPFNPKPD